MHWTGKKASRVFKKNSNNNKLCVCAKWAIEPSKDDQNSNNNKNNNDEKQQCNWTITTNTEYVFREVCIEVKRLSHLYVRECVRVCVYFLSKFFFSFLLKESSKHYISHTAPNHRTQFIPVWIYIFVYCSYQSITHRCVVLLLLMVFLIFRRACSRLLQVFARSLS